MKITEHEDYIEVVCKASEAIEAQRMVNAINGTPATNVSSRCVIRFARNHDVIQKVQNLDY